MARFDCATWRPVGNHGGPMDDSRGLMLHHAVATGSLFGWFNNPASGVSAHFWVGLDGTIEQYVDTATAAWHAMQANGAWVGVETEGCSSPPHSDPMTDEMVAALARIYAEGAARHGWPNQLAESESDLGFGYHSMAVATACPCEIRKGRRADILAQAFGVGGPAPAPPDVAPPGVAPAWPGRYFEYPPLTTGTDVQTWQAQMQARGWAILVDGAYGPDSQEICEQFQAEKGLAIDGIVGPDTWAAAWTAPVT